MKGMDSQRRITVLVELLYHCIPINTLWLRFLFYIISERETATTALMEGGGPRGPGRGPSGNGFFNNNCNNNLAAAAAHAAANNGGDRSRLFRKSNGSKPVREWYV